MMTSIFCENANYFSSQTMYFCVNYCLQVSKKTLLLKKYLAYLVHYVIGPSMFPIVRSDYFANL